MSKLLLTINHKLPFTHVLNVIYLVCSSYTVKFSAMWKSVPVQLVRL